MDRNHNSPVEQKSISWKNRIFYNFSLVCGLIVGVLLERHLFSSGREGLLWHLFN